MIRLEEPFEFRISAEKFVSISVKTFFFFLRSPVFGRKNHLNFGFRPKNPSQFRINRLNLIQEQWKFGSRLLTVVSLFQNSPPLFRNPGYALGWDYRYEHERKKAWNRY